MLEKRPVSKANKAIGNAVCCVLLAGQCVTVAHVLYFERDRFRLALGLVGGQLLSAIGMTLLLISVPRRPDVYRNGKLVDRQYSRSLWAKWSLDWSSEILDESATKLVEVKDLPDMDATVRAEDAKIFFRSIVLKPTIPLWIQIFWAYRQKFVFQWLLTIFSAIVDSLPQLAVLRLLQYLEARDSVDVADMEAWLWVFSLLLATLLETLTDARIGWLMWGDLAIPIRVTLTSLLFEKMMKSKDVKEPPQKEANEDENEESKTASNESNTTPANGHVSNGSVERGKATTKPAAPTKGPKEEKEPEIQKSVVNMFAVDTNLVGHAAAMSQYYVMFASKFTVTVVFLLFLVGWESLVAGLVATAVFYPVNKYLVKRYQRFQKALMSIRDKKTTLVTEALSGIRQIKFSANEQEWSEKIMDIRKEELNKLWKTKVSHIRVLESWTVLIIPG